MCSAFCAIFHSESELNAIGVRITEDAGLSPKNFTRSQLFHFGSFSMPAGNVTQCQVLATKRMSLERGG